MENEGFDVNFKAKMLSLKDWQWEIGASVGHYKNKITALPDGAENIDNTIYGATIRSQVGDAANLFYGYKSLGVFSTTGDAQAAGSSDPNGLYFVDESRSRWRMSEHRCR